MLPSVGPDDSRNKPVDQPPPSADSSQPARPASWFGWNWLLRLLGVVVALGSGMIAGYGLPLYILYVWEGLALWEAQPNLAPIWWIPPAMIVGGVLAASLLGTWWAVLIVPVVTNAGITVALGRPVLNVSMFVWIIVPATIGAIIGTPAGGWVQRKIHRQAAVS